MHVNSLLHVRDHAKVRGTAHHLLAYIALHVNRHTGEAFELSVDRLAHWLNVTPQWVRQLRARLVVRDCNRNGSGLQSPHFWDRIICLYPSPQDRIICL